MVPVKRALISVSDRTGVAEFARRLRDLGIEIISTGGTAETLRGAGIEVRDVSNLTGSPEMLDGRVKTLHPKIHGGILARRDDPTHQAAMEEHEIAPIDLICVNLYPFEQTVASDEVSLEQAIEQIDIGGPAMIRSAAKNWRHVAVVTTPELYERIATELEENQGSLSRDTRRQLAQLAFMRTAFYDTAVFGYLQSLLDITEADPDFLGAAATMSERLTEHMVRLGLDFEDEDEFAEDEEFEDEDEPGSEWALGNGHGSNGHSADGQVGEVPAEADGTFPATEMIEGEKSAELRYGENPHQLAALYLTPGSGGIARAELLGGKEMSYNNYIDANAAWELVDEFDETACAIIKHTNPAGVAIGETMADAYRRALATDPVSAFGGIIALNDTVDADTARAVIEIFSEVVVAPEYSEEALEVLRSKKNLRILRIDPDIYDDGFEFRQISGGMLIQSYDDHELTLGDLRTVTERGPTAEELRDLLFAWKVAKHTKSNAIVYARDQQTVGVGAGQMSRVDSVKLGSMRAVLPVKGSVLASDAFFPFRDGLDEAAKSGITAVIQPGGSVRDDEVIAAADEHGLAMVFTGIRHFKH
jgi:phosphoribosylaminoimidazolecarboxamide formyltransferase/IMP cyclohydrolase